MFLEKPETGAADYLRDEDRIVKLLTTLADADAIRMIKYMAGSCRNKLFVPEKLAERRRALREAAALGVDLLSETDGATGLLEGLSTKSLTKKNRVISAELRNFQKNLDEKEIGS